MLTRYPADGPSSRLRMLQFIPALEAAGATVAVKPFFDEGYLKRYFKSGEKRLGDVAKAVWRRRQVLKHVRGNFDLIWVEKELFPFLPAIFEDGLKNMGVPYIVDYDDATFHTYDLSNSSVVRRLLSHKLEGLIAGARAVTVGNMYLEEYVRQFAAGPIVRIPTVVDLRRYPVQPFPKHDALQLGWIGTPNNARYLAPVIEAMKTVKNKIAVNLITVGAQGPLLIEGQVLRPWCLANEGADISSFDVGVMPIPDEPWERGKCGYKLIQYLAGGRPVIASPVGINREIVTQDVGFLATHHDEWVRAISELADRIDTKVAMGKAARQSVKVQYSLQATAPTIINILQQAINK
jgi:glycosyltransferase involved in cell wall biosynthesis